MAIEERKLTNTAPKKFKNVDDVLERLTKDEMALQLFTTSNYAFQLESENKELRKEKAVIHNKVMEMWKFDFHADPVISRKVGNMYHVNIEEPKNRYNLDNTEEVINALNKTRRAPLSDELLVKNLEKAQKNLTKLQELLEDENKKRQSSKELNEIKDRTIERLTEELLEEKSKKAPIQVKGNGVKIIIKSENPAQEAVKIEQNEKIEIKKEIKEFSVEKNQEKIEVEEEKMIEKAENLAIYSLLENYNPKPPSNPVYDCDIDYKGNLAAVYCIKDYMEDVSVYDKIAEKTKKIFFIGEDEKYFDTKIQGKFITWMITRGKTNEVEYSFTSQNKLRETKELKELRKL